MLKLYDVTLSGNCHKVRLMLSLLKLAHEIIPVDLQASAQKSASFLKLNPFGQVPVLVDGDVVIRDAQAILVYLARRYGSEEWLPIDAQGMSEVVQWLSTTANEIQNGVAAARLHFMFNAQIDLDIAQRKAHQVLKVLRRSLKQASMVRMRSPNYCRHSLFSLCGISRRRKN